MNLPFEKVHTASAATHENYMVASHKITLKNNLHFDMKFNVEHSITGVNSILGEILTWAACTVAREIE